VSIEIYVAVDGKDTQPGTQKRPFATLARARDALRALPAAERAGSTVWIGGGDYSLTETLRLGNRDGGRPEAPVTWRAQPKQRVRLLGGITLSGFTPVRDPAVRARLDPTVRRHVRQVDLRALGVGRLSPMRSRGFGRQMTTAHVELFVDGEPQTVARWPNADADDPFARIADFPEGRSRDDGHGTQLDDCGRRLGTRVLGLRLGQQLRARLFDRRRGAPCQDPPASWQLWVHATRRIRDVPIGLCATTPGSCASPVSNRCRWSASACAGMSTVPAACLRAGRRVAADRP
jgi:hypothetical protein